MPRHPRGVAGNIPLFLTLGMMVSAYAVALTCLSEGNKYGSLTVVSHVR